MNAILQLLMPQAQLQSANQSSQFPSEASEVFQRMVNDELGKFLPPEMRKNAQLAQLLGSPVFKQLLAHLDALLSSMDISPDQKAQLTEEITAGILESFTSGETESLIPFFQGILQAETPEDLKSVLAKYSKDESAASLVGIFGQHLPASSEEGATQTQDSGSGIDALLDVEPTPKEVLAAANQGMTVNADKIPDKVNAEEVLAKIVEMFQDKEASFAKDIMKEGFDGPASQPGLNSPEAEFLSLLKSAQVVSGNDTAAVGDIETNPVDMQARVDLWTGIKELVDRIQVRAEPQTVQTVFDLKPPHLGQTHLRVELSEQKVVLDFLVKVPEAKEMIQNSLNDLHQMFQDKGMTIEQVNVEVNPNLSFDHGLFSPDLTSGGDQGHGDFAHIPSSILFDEETVRGYGSLYLGSQGVNCLA